MEKNPCAFENLEKGWGAWRGVVGKK